MSEQENLSLNEKSQELGLVHAANEARFTAAHFSEALTAFTVGWKDPENLALLLEFVSPSVFVGRRFEFKKANNAESFLSETNDVRAIGSAFKRIEYTGESVNEKTINKGLTIRVDHDEVHGDDWQERYVQLLVQRLYRNELRRALAALDKSATEKKVTWSKVSNPDSDLRKALVKAASISGVRPNRILFGEAAWDARAEAFEAKENIASIRSADLTPQEVARKLLADDSRIIRARYQAGDTKASLAENVVYAYFAQDSITKDEPSNLKRFITSEDNSGSFRVYAEEHAKYTDISVEHYSNIIVTSDLGIQKLLVSNG